MQINNIKNKLYYGISLLHRYKYKFNINTLVMLYFSFFHSHINYCSIILGSTYHSNIKCIQILQNKCMRAIYKLDNKTNIDYILLRHNILKFKDIIIYPFINICLEYITSIIYIVQCVSYLPIGYYIVFTYYLPTCSLYNYNINLDTFFIYNKDKTRFILPLMKTTKFQNTIFFKGPKYYNNIMSNNILKSENIHNIHKLKKVLKNYFLNKY